MFDQFLDTWNELLEARLQQAERNVAARLAKRFMPEGVWRFPSQSLLLPRKPVWSEINPSTTTFRRRLPGVNNFEDWTPTGPGWTRPIVSIAQTVAKDRGVFSWTLNHRPGDGEPSLLDAKRGLLVYVAAEEATVAALAGAKWHAQIAGHPEAVHVERYGYANAESIDGRSTGQRIGGYLEFENALRFAAAATPALETWLPPCYPYARKLLHLRFGSMEQAAREKAVAATVELSVGGEGAEWDALAARTRIGEDWLLVNPIPAAQMKTDWRPTDRQRRMERVIEVVFEDLDGVFASTGAYVSGYEPAPFFQDGEKTRVQCGKLAARAWVYFGSRGEMTPTDIAGNAEIENRESGEKYRIELAPIGGLTADFSDPASDASRAWWVRRFLRPAMLTHGDIQETLRQLPDCNRYFDLANLRFRLEGVNKRMETPLLWETYLWPSRISDPFLSYQWGNRPANGTEHTTDKVVGPEQGPCIVPITPVMRLTLPILAAVQLPEYLLNEIARHAASHLEQYFALGWYRIVAETER